MGTSFWITGATLTGSGGRAVVFGASLHPALNETNAATSRHPATWNMILAGLGLIWRVEIESPPSPAKGSRLFMQTPLRRCRARGLGICWRESSPRDATL